MAYGKARGRISVKKKSIFIPRATVSQGIAPQTFGTAKKPCGFGIFASPPLWNLLLLHIYNDDKDSECGFRFAKLKRYEIVWVGFFSLLLAV